MQSQPQQHRGKPEIEAVVSYSDPQAGHIGSVYAAMSSAYRGQTNPRTEYRIGGRGINGRTLSKIRLGERGAGGAVDQLVAAGAPGPMINEPLDHWLDRLSRERILLRAQHTAPLDLVRFQDVAGGVPVEERPTMASWLERFNAHYKEAA